MHVLPPLVILSVQYKEHFFQFFIWFRLWFTKMTPFPPFRKKLKFEFLYYIASIIFVSKRLFIDLFVEIQASLQGFLKIVQNWRRKVLLFSDLRVDEFWSEAVTCVLGIFIKNFPQFYCFFHYLPIPMFLFSLI